MSTLIVGGDSALGREIVHQLTEREEFIVSSRSRASSVFIDLTAPDFFAAIPDDVMNVIVCAAQMPHPGVPTSSYLEINALGPVRLAETCASKGVKKFIYISSIFASFSPDHPRYDNYSMSKRMGEEALTQLNHRLAQSSNQSMTISSLRLGVLFGNDTLNARNGLFAVSPVSWCRRAWLLDA